jgi:hypothetical protein
MKRITLYPDPQNALIVLHLDKPSERETGEDQETFVVQAVRFKAIIVAGQDAEHAAQGSVVNVEGAVMNLYPAALKARAQFIVKLDDVRLVHPDFVAR